jgi:hypothetical protein
MTDPVPQINSRETHAKSKTAGRKLTRHKLTFCPLETHGNSREMCLCRSETHAKLTQTHTPKLTFSTPSLEGGNGFPDLDSEPNQPIRQYLNHPMAEGIRPQ